MRSFFELIHGILYFLYMGEPTLRLLLKHLFLSTQTATPLPTSLIRVPRNKPQKNGDASPN